MKKQVSVALMMALLPAVTLAAKPEQCALDSTCSFSIHGKFNKEFITSQLQAGQTYTCSVIRGKGKLLSIKNIYASSDVSYDLKGERFNKLFVIHGPSKGTGYIKYTIYNNNDPWHANSIQFQCSLVR